MIKQTIAGLEYSRDDLEVILTSILNKSSLNTPLGGHNLIFLTDLYNKVFNPSYIVFAMIIEGLFHTRFLFVQTAEQGFILNIDDVLTKMYGVKVIDMTKNKKQKTEYIPMVK